MVSGNFPPYHWIYWAGPFMGSCLATAFYMLVRKLEYWTVNPHADAESGLVGAFLSGDDPKKHDKNRGEIHAEKSKGELCAETRRSKNPNHVDSHDSRNSKKEDPREKQVRPLPDDSPAEESTTTLQSTPASSTRGDDTVVEQRFAANEIDAEEARVSRVPTQASHTRTRE